MAHPQVEQLRFARSEFVRGLADVSAAVAARRIGPMNSIGWMVGHLAWHEQLYWLTRAQGTTPRPELNDVAASGAPASTPDLDTMWATWQEITALADTWLDSLTTADLEERLALTPNASQSVGTMLLRLTYHYFVHCGESSAVRQMVEGGELPEFIGDIQDLAPWRPDPAP